MNDEVLLKYHDFNRVSINGFVLQRITDTNGLWISTISNKYINFLFLLHNFFFLPVIPPFTAPLCIFFPYLLI